MSTDDNHERTATKNPIPPKFDQLPLQRFLNWLNMVPGISAGHPRDSAQCCGALGCTLSEEVMDVIPENRGLRTVCRAHAIDLAAEEVEAR